MLRLNLSGINYFGQHQVYLIALTSCRIISLTASPIVAISWISNALAVSTGRHLLFYSSLLSTGKDCHQVAADLIGPLPMHHPQLLFQSLLHGQYFFFSPSICSQAESFFFRYRGNRYSDQDFDRTRRTVD